MKIKSNLWIVTKKLLRKMLPEAVRLKIRQIGMRFFYRTKKAEMSMVFDLLADELSRETFPPICDSSPRERAIRFFRSPSL